MVQGTLGPFELRLEEERVARDYEAPRMDAMLEVPVDRDLGDPSKVDALVLECRGVGDFAFPVSHRQSFTSGENGTSVLRTRRDFIRREGKGLEEGDMERYLRATPFIQADHPRIVERAGEIVAGEEDAVKAANLLQEWVFLTLEPSYKDNAIHALQVLDSGAGDCTEHALLFVALSRAVGIPAREVAGLAYAGEEEPFFAWHQWAEIHDGSQWISVDPTWGELFVDATHIRTWTEGNEDDISTMNLMFSEEMNCKVLEMKTSGEDADRRDGS
jgi:transglutaminase-like putative cysteine protease